MEFVGLIAAAIFFALVLRWWSEGIFDTSEAALLVGVFCFLIFGLFAAKTVLQFLAAFVSLAAAGGYAIYAYRIGGMRAYLKEQCGIYMETIQHDPRNLAARERFAESLHSLGELDRAIDEMQAAVNLGAGIECQYTLSQWQRERHVRDSTAPVCKWCGTESAAGTRKCPRCGAELPLQSALARWLTGGKWATARLSLLILVGLVLISVSLACLPVKFAFIPLALWGIALVGWALVGSAR